MSTKKQAAARAYAWRCLQIKGMLRNAEHICKTLGVEGVYLLRELTILEQLNRTDYETRKPK